MPRQTEPNANNALGGLLQPMLPGSEVRFENTRVIEGSPGLQPDLLITDPGRAPVVIEAEYLPAAHVEAEALARLDLPVTVHPRPIEAAIALRYPAAVGDAPDLRAALTAARLAYCVFTAAAAGVQRFPASGWLEGSVADLADLVRLVSVPQRAVDQAATTLQAGIDAAAKLLDSVDTSRPAITRKMAQLLGMANVPQTRRMACAIIANALVFHERIAGMYAEVEPLDLVCGDTTPNPKGALLAAWDDILDINYWPIFAIAQDLLAKLPAGDAATILRRLRETAQAISATGVDQAHDLTGRIFQRLIADRKYLATFYTLPASAALLARLAVAKLDGVDWADPRLHRPVARRRLCLRHRRPPVGRLRAPRCPARARRRRPGGPASPDDGGGAVRLRRDALRHPTSPAPPSPACSRPLRSATPASTPCPTAGSRKTTGLCRSARWSD